MREDVIRDELVRTDPITGQDLRRPPVSGEAAMSGFVDLWTHDDARTASGHLFKWVVCFLGTLEPVGFV